MQKIKPKGSEFDFFKNLVWLHSESQHSAKSMVVRGTSCKSASGKEL